MMPKSPKKPKHPNNKDESNTSSNSEEGGGNTSSKSVKDVNTSSKSEEDVNTSENDCKSSKDLSLDSTKNISTHNNGCSKENDIRKVFIICLVVFLPFFVLCLWPYIWACISPYIMAYGNSTINKITIKNLVEKFPQHSNEIKNIEYIINDVLHLSPEPPAVFLFLHKTDNNISDFIKNIAQYSSQKLETQHDFIEITPIELLSADDYGTLIAYYKPWLVEKRVMVVHDLQDIPGHTAQIFHSFCDEITPLVERAVYLLTLKVDSLDGKAENIADNTLSKHWKDLKDDILRPLITRVKGTVLKIQNRECDSEL